MGSLPPGRTGRAMTATTLAFVLGLTTGLTGCPKQGLVVESAWVEENAPEGPARDLLVQAAQSHQAGQFEDALELLQQARETGPDAPTLAYIGLREGMAHLRLGDVQNAVQVLSHVASSGPPDLASRARRLEALALYEQGQLDEARKLLADEQPQDLNDACDDDVLVQRLLDCAGRLALRDGAFLQCISHWSWSTRDLGTGKEALNEAQALLDELDDGLDAAVAEGLSVPSPTKMLEAANSQGPLWALLCRRAALAHLTHWDLESAESLGLKLQKEGFGAVAGPVLAAVDTARQELASTDPSTIGVLLPLTGKNAGVGKMMKQGIETALRILQAKHDFNLVYLDTAQSPDIAREHVRALKKEHRAIAAIGPAAASTSLSAAEEASLVGLPLITLSPTPGLTAKGEYVLRNFSTHEDEASLLATWAVQESQLTHLAVLHPDNGYGRTMAQLFKARAEELGATVELVVAFNPGQTSFVDEASKIEKASEVQAVFLPVTSGQLSLIGPSLAYRNVWPSAPGTPTTKKGRTVTLLTPQVAFSPDLPSKSGKFLQGTVFSTGFFPSTQDVFGSFFAMEFERDHGTQPTVYHSYAADALFVLAQAVVSGQVFTRRALLDWLLDPALCGPELPTVGAFGGFEPDGEPHEPLGLIRIAGKGYEALGESDGGQ